jgi:hypothetical protein
MLMNAAGMTSGSNPMVAAISSIHESDNHGQELLNEVVQVFADLLIASGATVPMIQAAMEQSVQSASENVASTRFTELGALLRDCMEVMCTWRRDVELINSDGEPMSLPMASSGQSFETLCRKANCRHQAQEIVRALIEFGAVSVDGDGKIQSETPTFILGRSNSGGRLATDALLKHLSGFLKCVHRNVRSVSGQGKPKFERACTVTVAIELEPIFDRLVRRRGQEFIDSIDEWLERNTKLESPAGKYIELGAGAYFVDFGERQGRKRTLT